MTSALKLLCVFAHPDDESLGMAGTLAAYAAEGVQTHLITATRGERGWPADRDDYPGAQELGRLREAELRAAAQVLGIRQVIFLDYMDGDLDQVQPQEAIAKIVIHVRTIRPHVVVTFGPDGGYGHPDHIAISQFTTTALVCAADDTYSDAGILPPYRVPKLYYRVWTAQDRAAYTAIAGDIGIQVDGARRRQVAWETWAVTTWVDTTNFWQPAWQAVSCHKTQLQGFNGLANLTPEMHRRLWGSPHGFYRTYSTVNGGRKTETDLFEGLRDHRVGAIST
ncbi:MAG: PIG-L family deacetylase [Chloroflexi bacterium]|nr:PIG-L family deacetylase [Chloroflexota bacterium]